MKRGTTTISVWILVDLAIMVNGAVLFDHGLLLCSSMFEKNLSASYTKQIEYTWPWPKQLQTSGVKVTAFPRAVDFDKRIHRTALRVMQLVL